MKKVFSLFLSVVLLLTMTTVAFAQEATLEITPPDKVYYLVGEEVDYTGGLVRYINGESTLDLPLSAENCQGADTATPGNKTVTVKAVDKVGYFRVTVLDPGDPILEMKDVSSRQWYYKALALCMKAGFFEGDDQKNAHPNGNLTRAQLATLLYRVHESDPRVMMPKADAAQPFTDVKEGQWFYDAVENCRAAGIINGMGDGTFAPNATIKREDAILMIVRTLYSAAELDAADPDALLKATGLVVTDFDKVSSYAKKAMALGLGSLIKGDDKGALNPKSSISRAETATILQRQFLAGYQWDPARRKPLIYLSPSNQIHNSYKNLPTTEGYEMIKVANILEEILLQKGYEVVNPDVSVKIKDRAKEANDLQADVYVALHTNAGGNVTGTEAFYNGANKGSAELATEIYNRVKALTGYGRKLKEDYLCLQDENGNFKYGTPFVEVGEPKVANVLLEVEFHDKADKALWITQNTRPIAVAVANGIIAYIEGYVDLATSKPTPPAEEQPPAEEPPAEEPPAEEQPPENLPPENLPPEEETPPAEEELPVITGRPPLQGEETNPEEPENNERELLTAL